jgi:hypothetical protein
MEVGSTYKRAVILILIFIILLAAAIGLRQCRGPEPQAAPDIYGDVPGKYALGENRACIFFTYYGEGISYPSVDGYKAHYYDGTEWHEL